MRTNKYSNKYLKYEYTSKRNNKYTDEQMNK